MSLSRLRSKLLRYRWNNWNWGFGQKQLDQTPWRMSRREREVLSLLVLLLLLLQVARSVAASLVSRCAGPLDSASPTYALDVAVDGPGFQARFGRCHGPVITKGRCWHLCGSFTSSPDIPQFWSAYRVHSSARPFAIGIGLIEAQPSLFDLISISKFNKVILLNLTSVFSKRHSTTELWHIPSYSSLLPMPDVSGQRS